MSGGMRSDNNKHNFVMNTYQQNYPIQNPKDGQQFHLLYFNVYIYNKNIAVLQKENPFRGMMDNREMDFGIVRQLLQKSLSLSGNLSIGFNTVDMFALER